MLQIENRFVFRRFRQPYSVLFLPCDGTDFHSLESSS